MIRPATAADAQALCDIYNPYIEKTVITFEEVPLAAAAMAQRVADIQAGHMWHVAEEGGRLLGYAYAGPWRPRAAYRYAVETSVYLAEDALGRGVGRALYEVLLDELPRKGFRCAMGGIALPNDASVRLHEAMGFVKVAHFEDVGFKFGQWIPVGYWQRIFA
mgnify:CR=1 FL=1